jgi:hypothetical protein
MADTPVNPNQGQMALTSAPPSLALTAGPDSSAAGVLPPLSSPIYDNPLEDFFHDFLVALSGLPGDLVRPRWQPEPPNMPDFSVNWLAFGFPRIVEDVFAYEGEDPGDRQRDIVERDEILTMLMSFYGPQGGALGKRVSASLQISQNRAYLRTQNIGVVEVEDQIRLPALLKEKWVPRVDINVRFRRRAGWVFAIRTVESVDALQGLNNELYITPIIVNPPTP